MGGLEAEAFFQVGSFLQGENGAMEFDSPTVDTALAHGIVGGLFSIGQKGGFPAGFLSAGMASAADSPALDSGPIGDTVAHAVAGGAGAVLGGGKFANGAITGAFGYLFNSSAHDWAIKGALIGSAIGGAAAAAGTGACAAGTAGTCAAAAPVTIPVGMAQGAADGAAIGAGLGSVFDSLTVHGNSADSMRGTEVYYLINRDSGAIDKIGITSDPDQRYSQAYLDAENVRY